ncbi:hypothetical protein LCGC14_2762240, partial [marine sediment metagenome]
MAEDHASEAYTPEDTNGDTVKDILTKVVEATLTCFSHCKAYTITFDTGYDSDTLIDTFKPADYFSVASGESRLSVLKRLISWIYDKAIIKADGAVHILYPTVTGVTYASEYNDAYGDYHNFFDKSVRKRLVIPNKVIVSSHPDHSPQYTGNDTDADSYAALGNRYITSPPYYIRATSNAQCTSIASAKIQNLQLATERGHGIAPMNVGQEVLDYVKITDSRVGSSGDTRTGNIGYINRWYSAYPKQPTRFGFEFRFGSLEAGGLAGTMPPRMVTISDPNTTTLAEKYTELYGAYGVVYDRLGEVIANQSQIVNYLTAISEYMWKLHVGGQLIIPVWIPGAPTITTQAVSDIATTTATGNITLTDLGVPDPTAYGVCWSTSSSPTIADDTTDEGAATETGVFTTDMTSLTTGTLYYVRAY